MHKSKFLDIVRTFSPDEIKQFRIFVRSPFHNTSKNVIRVTEIVKDCYPSFDSAKLEKESVFAEIYPGKKYNDAVMRILLSDLLTLAEEFLAYKNFTSDTLYESRYLLPELSKRNLNTLFASRMKQVKKRLAEPGKIEIYHFLDAFEFESMNVNHLISLGKQAQSAKNVASQGESLVTFFLINAFNIAHELVTQSDVLSVRFDSNLTEELLHNIDFEKFFQSVGSTNYRYNEILRIYYLMYHSYATDRMADVYDELKMLILKNLERFSREEKFNLFIILESICNSPVRIQRRSNFNDLFELYRIMLEKKIYTHSESEYFQLNLFRNMFYTAAVLKKFEWAEKFLENHLNEISPEFTEDMLHFAKAFISFGKSQYEDALKEISQVKYNFFVFKFDVRVLTLKIYYELNVEDQAYSLIDSFTHFLNDNPSAGIYRESFQSFLRYVKKLLRLKNGAGEESAGLLLKQIQNETRLIASAWLTEKASELAGKKK